MSAVFTALTADCPWLSALLAGTVFLLSGVLKLIYWTRFRDTLSAMGLFPVSAARAVGWVLPPLETALGAAVVAQWRLALTGPALLGLLVGFILALAVYRWRRGQRVGLRLLCRFRAQNGDRPPHPAERGAIDLRASRC